MVLQYPKVTKMSFGEELTRTDQPNFPPQHFLTKAILTARKSRQRRTKWWVGLKMDLKCFWPDFSSVNTLPPKSQCPLLDLSVLYVLIPMLQVPKRTIYTSTLEMAFPFPVLAPISSTSSCIKAGKQISISVNFGCTNLLEHSILYYSYSTTSQKYKASLLQVAYSFGSWCTLATCPTSCYTTTQHIL